MRPRPGVRMGACESSPRRRPGLLVHDPVPVLAGVKVLPPPGRFTLTPAAAGELSRYGKPNKPRLRAGRALLRLLTEPDPMGAQTAPASTRWTIRCCLVNSRLGFESPASSQKRQVTALLCGYPAAGSRCSRRLERWARASWRAWRVANPRTRGASVANLPSTSLVESSREVTQPPGNWSYQVAVNWSARRSD